MSFFADHNEMIFYGQINVLPYIINIMMFRGQIRDAEHKRAKLDQLQQVSLFRKSIKMKTGSFFYCLLKGQREIKLLTVNFIEVVHPENQTIKNRKFKLFENLS